MYIDDYGYKSWSSDVEIWVGLMMAGGNVLVSPTAMTDGAVSSDDWSWADGKPLEKGEEM